MFINKVFIFRFGFAFKVENQVVASLTNPIEMFGNVEPQPFYMIVDSGTIVVGRGGVLEVGSLLMIGNTPEINLLGELELSRYIIIPLEGDYP